MEQHLSRREFCACAIKTAIALPLLASASKLFAQAPSGQILRIAPMVTVDLTDPLNSALKTVHGGVKIKVVGETKPIMVVRFDETTYTSFSCRCPHEGSSVALPSNGKVTCPNHGAEFDLEGKLLKGPAVTDLTPFYTVATDTQVAVYREPVGIADAPTTKGVDSTISVNSSEIAIHSPYSNGNATLFTVTGKVVQRALLSHTGNGSMPVSGISAGIYILTVGAGQLIQQSFMVKL